MGVKCYTFLMPTEWNQVLSEFLINIAAGWFGAVIIVPNFSDGKGKTKIAILIVDLVLVIVCLLAAFQIRKI